MPRLKRQEQPFEKVTRLLKGYGYNAPALSVVMVVSENTARKKLNNPELLTLGELKQISRRAGIPWEEFKNNI